jgi:general secretion pathway protein I
MQVLKIDAGGRFHRGPLSFVHRFKARAQRPRGGSLIQAAAFTLLEVMVALAVMSIVLVSVYRMHSQTLAMNAAARFYTHAPLLAQSKLAELEANASAMSAGDSGDFGEDFPGYHWTVAAEDLVAESLGDVARDLKRIDVTVSFNNNEFVYNFRTYRFIRE